MFDKASINALVDGIIVFFISLITSLLLVPGLPPLDVIYRSFLTAFLAALVFWGKKRGIDSAKEPVTPYS